MSEQSDNYFIKDYDYILSSVGNAYFSGLSFNQLWDSIMLSENREQLDIAISFAIKLKEIGEKNK